MVRRRISYDRNGLKKGTWSQEEDDILRAYVQRHGHSNWLKLPRLAGLSRSGKSCRLRWMNYLRPNVKRGNYTQEEDEVIIKLHEELGNKWCIIASNLPGRTDNEIKNHWHTKLKKRVERNTTASEEEKDESIETSKFKPNKNKEVEHDKTVFVDNASLNILESSQVSSELPYHSRISSSLSSDAHAHSSGENSAAVDSIVASSDIFSELLSGDFWSEPFLADNNQYDFSATILGEEPFTFPYISFDDDMVDYFYL